MAKSSMTQFEYTALWFTCLVIAKMQAANTNTLTPEESMISSAVVQLRLREVDRIGYNIEFYKYKQKIEKSRLFSLIKQMPKGASLDGHLFGLISQDFLYSLTFSPDLCMQIKGNGMRFSYGCLNSSGWLHLPTLRQNKQISEDMIKSYLSFQTNDVYTTAVYQKKLSNVYNAVKTLLSKQSVLEASIYQMLKGLYEDNIIYVEFRYSLDFYDSKTKRKYNPLEVLEICDNVIKNFTQSNVRFFGAKIIFSPQYRNHFNKNFQIAMNLAQHYPDLLIGYDMKSTNLVQALEMATAMPNSTQVFVLHDRNIDFKLNTNLDLIHFVINRQSRYLYNNIFLKNKLFRNHIRRLGAGISLCPLCLLRVNLPKLRSHSAVQYINEHFRIITINQYSGFWKANGISYDWYLLYVFMVQQSVDLSFLKQMAINSLIYSGLSDIDTSVALSMWNELWNEYIGDITQLVPIVTTTSIIQTIN